MRGSEAEDAALDLLKAHRLRLICRNFRCRGGELDLVMLDGETLVIVEVRARSHPGYASAAESVDARKQARIVHAAQLFLASHPHEAMRPMRFDVVAFDGLGRSDWIRGAFDAC
jgi:putative endonuclease